MEYWSTGVLGRSDSMTPTLQHQLIQPSMQIIENISAMRDWSEAQRRAGRRIVLCADHGVSP